MTTNLLNRLVQAGPFRLKAGLLGAVGLSLLMGGEALALPPTYEGLCELVAETVTCEGDEPGEGVSIGDIGISEIIIRDLTSNIAPAEGISGVVLDSTGSVSANIDLGEHSIVTTADGILISGYHEDESPTASLTLLGNVTSDAGRGVVVIGVGSATSDTTGDINSLGDALTVNALDGGLDLDHAGNLTSLEGRGIHADGNGNDISVTGNIDSLSDGIYSHSREGGLTSVVVNGNITSHQGSGIIVEEDGGTASVTVTGNIAAGVDGIAVWGEGAVTVNHTGDLSTGGGMGIYGRSASSGVTITHQGGSFSAGGDAIVGEAYGSEGVTITSTTDVASNTGRGVVANAPNGSVDITLSGKTTATLDAIVAESLASGSHGIDIDSDGAILSYEGRGIYANAKGYGISADGKTFAIRIDQVGDVTAQLDAITAITSSGNLYLDIHGNVTSYEGKAIDAYAALGLVEVNVDGSLTSKLDAVNVTANSGTVDLVLDGITSYEGKGVAVTASNGAVTVETGAISSKLDAVTISADNGAVSLDLGGITSSDGKGIGVTARNGAVTVETGTISSKLDAIAISADNGAVNLDLGGVTSYNGKGVGVIAKNGGVGLDIGGSIVAGLDAINIRTEFGAVDIDVVGNVISHNGKGISASTNSGNVDVDVGGYVNAKLDAVTLQTNSGNINLDVLDVTSLDGRAISASTNTGSAVLIVDGDVGAKLDAITANADSNITIDVSGKLTSNDGKGVSASSNNGQVSIAIDGDVTSKLDALIAETFSSFGGVTIDLGGDVTSWDGKAIKATAANGSVTIDVAGSVVSKGDAIYAKTTGGASNVTITTLDGITSYDGRAVYGESSNGRVTVNSTGAVTAGLDAITVKSTGEGTAATVSVTQNGKVTSYQGTGINAESSAGPVSVGVIGGVEAELNGIVARSYGGDHTSAVSVTTSGGSIVAYKGTAITATSTREGVSVINTGDIYGHADGIYVEGTGNTNTSQVVVQQTGDITVGLDTARGIHLSSYVDGEITLDGDISGGGYGIHATSLHGAIEVSIADGNTISGAGVRGAYLESETGVTFTNRGNLSSATGTAFEIAGIGGGTVHNYGTITGDFSFASSGTFYNHAGSTLQAGNVLNLAGGLFDNSGVLSLTTGQITSIGEDVFLTGDYTQNASGTLMSDISFGDNSSDRLVVSGAAALAGTVTVNVTEINGGIYKDFRIVTADGGVTVGDISLSNPVLTGSVLTENDYDAILRITDIDFGVDGIKQKVVPTGDYVQEVFKTGAPESLAPLFAELMSTPDVETYEDALDQLDPEQYAQQMASTSVASLGFANRLLSCRVADGPDRFKTEGECDWFGVRLSVLEQEETDLTTAFEQTFATLEAGTQKRLDGNWLIGGGVGITNSVMAAGDGSRVEGNQAQAGVVIKYDADALLLASSFSGGYGLYQSDRHVQIGAFDETLSGEAPIAYLSGRFHGAYTFDMGAAYIKPLFNVDLTATHFGGVTETGGDAALTIDPGTQYTATFNPAVEFGGEIGDSSGKLLRPFVQVGLEASIASDLDLEARFTGVDPSVGNMVLSSPTPEPAAKLSVGADVLTSDQTTIRVYYDGSFTASSSKNGLGLKMSGTLD